MNGVSLVQNSNLEYKGYRRDGQAVLPIWLEQDRPWESDLALRARQGNDKDSRQLRRQVVVLNEDSRSLPHFGVARG